MSDINHMLWHSNDEPEVCPHCDIEQENSANHGHMFWSGRGFEVHCQTYIYTIDENGWHHPIPATIVTYI